MPRVLILSNPRSGSTLMRELLNCHQEVEIVGELLNDEFGRIENPIENIQSILDDLHSTIVGFKVFPEQIFVHNLHFGSLLQVIGTTHVVVLWREGILETLASRRIADKDGEWYSTKKRNGTKKIEIDGEDLKEYTNKLRSDWEEIGSQWPVDVRPIFVKFEDFIRQPVKEIKRVFAELSCNSEMAAFKSPSQRLNPAPVEDKVINFHELPPELRDGKLNVHDILMAKINISLQIPTELLQFAPDREPFMPAGGWRYRVAEPYLPAIAKQNAFDAIQSGSISSAGYWPREMATRLRALFHCPVAQPCSNGFTALMLAMQTANIGEGDEVILPTMTMVAVPNAVYYLKGKSVFADNAKDAYNPDWDEFEKQATSKTKAVIVTHTYGVPVADIEEIAKQCKSRGWVLIEDISECVGVTCSTSDGGQRLLGTFGDFAIASLYANKIIHGGDGGFVIAKEAKVGKRLASIVNHGFTPSFHFVHFEQAPNAKIHGIGAAIAAGCLNELDTVMTHRSQLATWYRKNLQQLPIQLMPQCGPKDTPWVFGIKCESKAERTKLRAFMAKQGIETRDFFFNLHLQPAYFPKGGMRPPSLPNAEILGSTGFYLPTHSNLKEEDVQYICDLLKLYFSINEDESTSSDAPVNVSYPSKPPKWSVQIEPSGFALQVRKYRETGELSGVSSRGHLYIQAVKLGSEAEEILFHERYDQVTKLLTEMKVCLSEAEGDPLEETMKNFFQPYINYFEAHELLEQTPQRPWLMVDLNDDLFHHSRKLPTTTDPETLQFIVWLLRQQKPETIWEIGSWMGHATVLMSEVCSDLKINHKVFACDAFKWQLWMHHHVSNDSGVFENGKSFLQLFKDNVKPFAHNVESVIWPYDISKLPIILENQRPQLVFLDITQEDEDLEQIWGLIKNSLVLNETIIVFNGLTRTSIPFFSRHADELKPLAKPYTMAKAFRFVSAVSTQKPLETYEDVQEMMQKTIPLRRSLKFHSSPGWDHHHRNLFCKSIDILKQELHSDLADVIFVPAIEETLCDEPDLFYENSWIGIIHSVQDHPELFYTADLHSLCTNPRYIAALKNCKGLFTLTSFQANYLRKHLPEGLLKFPIQRLHYPTEVIPDFGRSLLPQLMKGEEKIDMIHVGSFARDFHFFFKLSLPPKFRKVLVAGDEDCQEIAKGAPNDVTVVGRLTNDEYEEKLRTSIVLLTLKYEGAANTLILECIARSVPILSPNISSCTEYLGLDYPLLYDPTKPDQLGKLLTEENINNAISYLEEMDKSKLNLESFVKDVKNGAVLVSLPPALPDTAHSGSSVYNDAVSNIAVSSGRSFQTYDVTICICSYKRTHHLLKLLESLWNQQDFTGTYQILIWNNNDGRNGTVRDIAMKYIRQSTNNKSLELVNSTENYYCSIRFALPALMKSNCALICDDDIVPGNNFISFFYSAHRRHPEDVLCVRGHQFLPHKLNPEDPTDVWMNYDSLKFRDDHQPEELIHFVHADACLIPKKALQEVSSVPMPDPTFALVDDYWMSFILSHKFNRNLRKLSVSGLSADPITRTEDSDKPGLALHTRPEVQDARLRLYVHHMLQGWPNWNPSVQKSILNLSQEMQELVKKKKETFWGLPPQIGFNIHSSLAKQGITDLAEMGVKCVRIGAVGVGGNNFFELSGFLTEPQDQLEKLGRTVELLRNVGIDVIITLHRRLASPETWSLIAEKFCTFENVVGYDLINEPFTEHETGLHWSQMEEDIENDDGLETLTKNLTCMIHSIREKDQHTAVILEPTFWGRIGGLKKFPIENLLKIDSNLVFSVHFYEPMTLTSRIRNKGRYSFPSSIPWFENVKFTEETYWDSSTILETLQRAKMWATEKGVRLFVGEFGICREIAGAPEYLRAVMDSCKKLNMSGLAFSYRDNDWDAMNYFLGPNKQNYIELPNTEENPLVKALLDGIAKS